MSEPGRSSVNGRDMAEVYSRGPMARIIAADGASNLMNLGYAPPRDRRTPSARRQRDLALKTLCLLEPRPGQVVLDLGCGRGGVMVMLAATVPGIATVGLNIDPAQLAMARRHLAGQRAELVIGDAVRLPFRPGAFDRIYAIELTAHIADKLTLAAEISWTLKPGGRVVLAYLTLNRQFDALGGDEQEHLRRVAAFFNQRPDWYLTHADYGRFFEGAGLILRESNDLTDGVFPRRHAVLLAELRRLESRSPRQRLRRWLDHRIRWKVNDATFRRFLEINTERHPCRYFEYHVTAWERA